MQVVDCERPARRAARAGENGDALYRRLDRYLLAFGLCDEGARACALSHIRERIACRLAAEPGLEPNKTAIEELQKSIQDWWDKLAPKEGEDPGAACIGSEELALFLHSMPPECQPQLVQSGPLPPELRQAARQSQMRPHPDLQRSAMVAQPFDLGPIHTLVALRHNPFFKVATGAAWLFGLIVAVMFLFEHL